MRLPSLTSLRAFEAAARLGSFKRAAEELSVTPSAVSQQIRALEDDLGEELFRRAGRNLALTDIGSAYAPGLADGFARILEATANARAGMQPRSRLRVSMLASFAFGWLNTRLPDFRRRYPDIDILVDANPRNADIRRGEADMAIRYGVGAVIDGLQSEPFLEEDLYPVCSPALVNGPTPLRRLKDIDDHPLIHDLLNHPGEPWNAWAPWFALAGIDRPPPPGPSYTETILINQAAIQGQGIAIGRSALVDDALTQGLLVRPFEIVRPADYAYWIIMTPSTAETRAATTFRDWLLEMADEAAGGGRAAPRTK
ncbi:MAG: transcriptional regulator GcvA [Alphaproteobacteria bacterium]|nr:transcriptional regulator GcvA [Alphaproteobacteria bacterium]